MHPVFLALLISLMACETRDGAHPNPFANAPVWPQNLAPDENLHTLKKKPFYQNDFFQKIVLGFSALGVAVAAVVGLKAPGMPPPSKPTLTLEDIHQQKQDFLKQKLQKKGDSWLYNQGISLSDPPDSQMPRMPYLGTYGASAMRFLLTLSLPDVYYTKVPAAILGYLQKYPNYKKDLFLNVQSFSILTFEGEGCARTFNHLITHHWALLLNHENPGDPNANTYHNHMKMAIFGLAPREGYYLTERLQKTNVHVHHGRYSPDTAHVPMPLDESSHFWSLVIDDADKRAAITFHFVFLIPKTNIFNVVKKDFDQKTEGILLEDFFRVYDNINNFKGSAHFLALKEFFDISSQALD